MPIPSSSSTHSSPTCATWCWKWAGLVEDQIKNAVKSLDDEDLSLAREVIARDQIINGLQVKIDEDTITLIATRQPVGSDLRLIMSLSKAVTDLERIGDEAEKIARMTIKTYDVVGSRPAPSCCAT